MLTGRLFFKRLSTVSTAMTLQICLPVLVKRPTVMWPNPSSRTALTTHESSFSPHAPAAASNPARVETKDMSPSSALECQALLSSQHRFAPLNTEYHSEHVQPDAFACSGARPDGELQQQHKDGFSLHDSASCDSQPCLSASVDRQ
eukprot:8696048-Pyramimonas_sp.AAC.1